MFPQRTCAVGSDNVKPLDAYNHVTNATMLLGLCLVTNLLGVCILAPYRLAAHGAIVVLRQPLRNASLVKNVAAWCLQHRVTNLHLIHTDGAHTLMLRDR